MKGSSIMRTMPSMPCMTCWHIWVGITALSVDPGKYVLELVFTDRETQEDYYALLTEEGWVYYGEEELNAIFEDGAPEESVFEIGRGEVIELGTEGLFD